MPNAACNEIVYGGIVVGEQPRAEVRAQRTRACEGEAAPAHRADTTPTRTSAAPTTYGHVLVILSNLTRTSGRLALPTLGSLRKPRGDDRMHVHADLDQYPLKLPTVYIFVCTRSRTTPHPTRLSGCPFAGRLRSGNPVADVPLAVKQIKEAWDISKGDSSDREWSWRRASQGTRAPDA
jgi:hypothetical protein